MRTGLFLMKRQPGFHWGREQTTREQGQRHLWCQKLAKGVNSIITGSKSDHGRITVASFSL